MDTSDVNKLGTRDASCPIAWYVNPRTAALVKSEPAAVSAGQQSTLKVMSQHEPVTLALSIAAQHAHTGNNKAQ